MKHPGQPPGAEPRERPAPCGRAVISEVVVATDLARPTWKSVWKRQLRWDRTIRASHGGFLALESPLALLLSPLAGRDVEWRGQRVRLTRDGALERLTDAGQSTPQNNVKTP